MATSQQTSTPPPSDDAVDRANRVRAMLARWATETVTDEPEWNVESIEPMALESDSGGRTRQQ